MAFYTGIDLGKKKADITVIDDKGNIKAQGKIDANIESVLAFIKPYRKKQRIVFETCGTYYWLSDGLMNAGYSDVTMAHALKLAHIIRAKVKTDRRDSLALAELHRVGYIPEGYIYPVEERALRDLARRRLMVVRKRAGDFRDLKMILTRHGMSNPSRNAIPSLTEELLDEYKGFDDHLDHILNDTYNFNQAYTESIKNIENKLNEEMEEDELTQRIMLIPGVGKTLSKTLRLEIGNIERFKNLKHFCSWCRVVPGIAQSGESSMRGRGSKQGNAFVKSAFMQAASAAIRIYPEIKAYYVYHCERRRSSGGKMVSLNVIAHKLAKAVWMAFKGHEFNMNSLFDLSNLEDHCA
jgi:transposase